MRRRADFDRVFQQGRHHSGRLMAVRSVANEQPASRHAFAISRKVGNAVTRNRIKRRFREILRLSPLREGFDIVIVARPAAADVDFQKLKSELLLLLARAKLLEGPE